MKKISFFLASVFGLLTSVLYSQNQNLNSAVSYYEDYQKYNEVKSLPSAKEKIDLASANESTSGKYKTWYYRGLIYVAVFNQNLKNEMAKIDEKDPNKKLAAAYKNVSVAELDEALKSFQKEIELDDKKIYTNDANSNIKLIAYNYSFKADADLFDKNYTEAISYYEKAYDMRMKMNMTDTVAINNIAFAAVKLKDYKKAEMYYNKLIDMKYKPEKIYLYLIELFSDAGDTANARIVIMKARAAMPDSYSILVQEIKLYTNNFDNEANPAKKNDIAQKAITLLNNAIAKNPTEPLLSLALGNLYIKLAFPKDKDNKPLTKPTNFDEMTTKAEEQLKKSIEVKSTFDNNYALGIFYYNWCADINNGLDGIKDAKKHKEAETKYDNMLKIGIPYLEKAHELNPTERSTMKALRELYARTGQGETDKYKKLDAEYKGTGK